MSMNDEIPNPNDIQTMASPDSGHETATLLFKTLQTIQNRMEQYQPIHFETLSITVTAEPGISEPWISLVFYYKGGKFMEKPALKKLWASPVYRADIIRKICQSFFHELIDLALEDNPETIHTNL